MASGGGETSDDIFGLSRVSRFPLLPLDSLVRTSFGLLDGHSLSRSSISFVSPCFLAFFVDLSPSIPSAFPFDSSTITILDLSRPDCHSWPLYVRCPPSSPSPTTVSVTSLTSLSPNLLVSGNSDGSIRLWRLDLVADPEPASLPSSKSPSSICISNSHVRCCLESEVVVASAAAADIVFGIVDLVAFRLLLGGGGINEEEKDGIVVVSSRTDGKVVVWGDECECAEEEEEEEESPRRRRSWKILWEWDLEEETKKVSSTPSVLLTVGVVPRKSVVRIVGGCGGDTTAVVGVGHGQRVYFLDLRTGHSLGEVQIPKKKGTIIHTTIDSIETIVFQARPVVVIVTAASSVWLVPYPHFEDGGGGGVMMGECVELVSSSSSSAAPATAAAVSSSLHLRLPLGLSQGGEATVLWCCEESEKKKRREEEQEEAEEFGEEKKEVGSSSSSSSSSSLPSSVGVFVVSVGDGKIVGRLDENSKVKGIGGGRSGQQKLLRMEEEEEEGEEEEEEEEGEEEEGEPAANRCSHLRVFGACAVGASSKCIAAIVCDSMTPLDLSVELWSVHDRRRLSIQHREAALASGGPKVVGASFAFWHSLLKDCEADVFSDEVLFDLANEALAMTEDDSIASFAYAIKGGLFFRRYRHMRTTEDREKSLQMLNASLSLYSKNVLALFLRAETLSAGKEWDLAVEDYEKIVKLVEDPFHYNSELASTVVLPHVSMDHPYSPSRMRFYAGSCCFQNGNYERAAMFMRQCSEDDSAWRWFVQGSSLRHLGRTQSAMSCLSRILSDGLLDGELSESKVRHERAVSAFHLGRYAVALADLEHVVESTKLRAGRRRMRPVLTLGDSSSNCIPVSVVHLLVLCYEKMGKMEEARVWAELIVTSLRRMGKGRRYSLRGESCSASEASAQLGRICFATGDLKAARDAYLKAIEEADTTGTVKIPLQWYLDLAACQRQLGEYNKAMRTMTRCTEEFAVLGLVHLEKARLVMHQAESESSSSSTPPSASSSSTEEARHRAIGFLNEGIKMMGQVDSEGKETAMLLVERALLHSQNQAHALAIDDLDLAVSLDSENGRAWLMKGKTHHLRAEFIAAIDSLTTALAMLSETGPTIAEAHFYRAKAFFETYQYALATADLSECVEICPEYPGAADLQESISKNSKLRACEEKARLHPDDPQSLLDLAECRAELGQLQDALACLTRVVKLGETSPELRIPRVRYLRAEVLLNLGKGTEALRDLDEYVQFCRDDSMGWFLRGKARRMLDDFDGAIEDLTVSIDLNSRFVDAIVERGKVFLEKGMYDKAESDMSIASFLNANRAEVWILRGRIRMQMSQPDLACEDFVRASGLDHANGEAWYWRAQVMELQKKRMLVFEYLSRALLRDDAFENRLNALYQRASTSLSLSIFDQGVRDCLEVIRLQPEDYQIHLLASQLYEEMAQFRNAVHHIDEALGKCNDGSLLSSLKKELLPKRRVLERQRLKRKKDIRRRVGILRKQLRQFFRLAKRLANLDDIEELWGLIDREVSSLTWLFEEEEMEQDRRKAVFDSLVAPFFEYVNSHRIIHRRGGIRCLQEGEMEDGFLVGEGKIFSWDSQGSSNRPLAWLSFEGTFARGLKNGPGREFDSESRLVFEGIYQDGVRHGKGCEFYLEGGGKKRSGIYLEDGREGWFDVYAEGGIVGEDQENPEVVSREFWREGKLWRRDIAHLKLLEFDAESLLQSARASDRIKGGSDFRSVFRVWLDGVPLTLKVYSSLDQKMSSELQRRDFCEALESWVKEMATLCSPNVVPVLGYGSSANSNSVGFLMPNSDRSVRRWIAQTDNPSLLDKLKIALGTCRGLSYLHELGLVHGCLSWNNVIIADRAQMLVQLTDCGLRLQAERVMNRVIIDVDDGTGGGGASSSPALTQAQNELRERRLRPLYYAPELLADSSAAGIADDPSLVFSPASDTYAFGICLYVLLFREFNPLKETASGFAVTCQDCRLGHLRELWGHIVECGLRPEMPIDMRAGYESTKRIMTRCWCQEAHDRISMEDAERLLQEVIDQIEGKES